MSWVMPSNVLAGEPSPPSKSHAQDREKVRAEIREKVRAFRNKKLYEVLKADEATKKRLVAELDKMDDRRGELRRAMMLAGKTLKEHLQSDKTDDATINKHVDEMLKLRTRMHALEAEGWAAARKILTPTDFARSVLVLPRIMKGLQREIFGAMGKDHPRGGKHGGHHGGPDGGDHDDVAP